MAKDNYCENCPHRDALCANGYCVVAQSKTEPEKAAEKLAQTGNRSDLQEYLKARRNIR